MSEVMDIPNKKIEEMVVRGLNDVFHTMLKGDITLEKCIPLKAGAEGTTPLVNLDELLVIGTVGFVGAVTGMVYVTMPESLAMKIARIMLHMEESELEGEHEIINDVIGELTNMSAGAYKNQMADMGYPCRLTIPSIIRGKNFVVESAMATVRQIYLFKFRGETFSFELIMRIKEPD